MKSYLITTERLGLRNWIDSDLAPFAAMCADAKVMEHFPKTLTTQETATLIEKLKAHFKEYGYCYFAVDLLATGEFIGFTGYMTQSWESEFTPCVDMGWRLKQSAWGKGYATEAAAGCVKAALNFNITELYAFATDTNKASQQVMTKVGMHLKGTVQHPAIIDDPRFAHCVVYKLTLYI